MPGARAVLPVDASPRLRRIHVSPTRIDQQLNNSSRPVQQLRRPMVQRSPTAEHQQRQKPSPKKKEEETRKQSSYGRAYKKPDRYQP